MAAEEGGIPEAALFLWRIASSVMMFGSAGSTLVTGILVKVQPSILGMNSSKSLVVREKGSKGFFE
jgi:hypothetical protein